ARRPLNSSVLPRSCSSERAIICSSRALTACTVLSIRFTSRSFLLPKSFFHRGANISTGSSGEWMEVGANRDLAAGMAAGEGGILPGKAGEESDVVSPLLPCDGANRVSPENQGHGVI